MQLQSLKSDDTSQFMSLQPRLQGDGGGGPALGRGRAQGRWLGLCWHHLALTIVEMKTSGHLRLESRRVIDHRP